MSSFKVAFEWPKSPPPFWHLDLQYWLRQELAGYVIHIQWIGGHKFIMEFKDEEAFALFMLMFDQEESRVYLVPLHYCKGGNNGIL